MTASRERTALYRYFDASGRLLYVGITRDPDLRLKEHGYNNAKWCQMAATRQVDWFASRKEAEAAELVAIRTEEPRFNGAHNFVQAPFDPSWWPRITAHQKCVPFANLIRREIASGRWVAGTRLPTAREMADAAGVGTSTVSKVIISLRREGVLTLHHGLGVFVTPYQRKR